MRENPPILLSSSLEPARRERVFYIDALRSVACVLVVASHIFAPICSGMNDYSRGDWWVFNLLDSFIRPCAALFVMISGKLILGSQREEPYSHFLRRRCLKLFIPFFIWSIIYVYMELPPGSSFSIGQAIKQFLDGPTEYHLWFMYMILALYTIAPFLRKFVRVATRADLRNVLLLWFSFLVAQFIFPESLGSGPTEIALNYGGFFLLGYVLDRERFFDSRLRTLLGAAVALILINACVTYHLTMKNHGVLVETFYSGDTPLQALYSAAFFLIFKTLPFDIWLRGRAWLRQLVASLSRETYNIYLVHAFFIWALAHGFQGLTLTADTTPLPVVGVGLTTLAVLACSAGFALLVKRLPLIAPLLVTGVKS